MIQSITDRLYADIPRERLYHYTTFSGLQGIVGSRRLWTSDVRYMNDSAELRHTADLIGTEVNRRIRAGHPRAKLLSQFIDWDSSLARDRKSTRLNSSHVAISYAVFCFKKKILVSATG